MIKVLIALFCIACPVAARAFSQCTAAPLAGPGAKIAEEGSNPVRWANYVYAGYTMKGKVGVAMSSDTGKTLGAPVTIFSGPDTVGGLRLGVSYQHVYATWGKKTGPTGVDLMFAVSQDHAKSGTWSTPVDLGGYKLATLTQISADAKNVHVAYVGTDDVIKIRNSTDVGRHFSAPVTVGPGLSEVVVKSLGQNVYVAWGQVTTRADTFVGVSHDGGATFKVTNLSANRPSGSNEPIFALNPNGDRLSLVWREDSPHGGVYLQSLDHGDTWTAPLPVDPSSGQYMAADDGNYVWLSFLKTLQVDGTNDIEVYLTRSIDGGKSFPPAKNLSGPTGISALQNDDERPIPWASADGAFRLTGVFADGVHAWSGNNGHVLAPAYLGPGHTASPAYNSMVWEGPEGVVMYGVCK
jgi:hypothetical protein